MPNLYPLARPLLWCLPPEKAHSVALRVLRAGLGRLATSKRARAPAPPILSQMIWGLRFSNPFGVAAGFDKDGYAPAEILRLGFGSVEVGTVTPCAQPGNETPRVFRLAENEAIINSMGFPSEGLDKVLRRLPPKPRCGILGINIGKNKDNIDARSDYAEGVRRTAALADYLVVNVSSPNTLGLRDLQRREPLEALLNELLAVRESTGFNPPLLVKIAPDLTPEEQADVAAVALSTGIDGIVIANTTVSRPKGITRSVGQVAGGLSGPPLLAKSTEVLAEMYRLTSGRLPLVGVGGVSSAADAYAKIRAGASLVQLHTALIYRGLNVIADLKEGLVKLLEADGFANITDAIGSGHTSGFGRPEAPPHNRSAASHNDHSGTISGPLSASRAAA